MRRFRSVPKLSRAKKLYPCDLCQMPVQAAQKYVRVFFVDDDGTANLLKLHLECNQFLECAELSWPAWPDDGESYDLPPILDEFLAYVNRPADPDRAWPAKKRAAMARCLRSVRIIQQRRKSVLEQAQ